MTFVRKEQDLVHARKMKWKYSRKTEKRTIKKPEKFGSEKYLRGSVDGEFQLEQKAYM